MSGGCEECGKKRPLGLQTKLKINEPGDAYEQEADRIADQVMAAPAEHEVGGAPLRIQRFSGPSNGQVAAAPASVDHALASPGRPLYPALRQDMEQRFGYDFSRVRMHMGAAAEQSAQEVNAHAYTVGHNIVFGAGQFSPATQRGRRLIAHELTHVLQNAGQPGVAPRLQRQKKCGHDQAKASGCGRISTESPKGEDIDFPVDRLIVEALQKDFPGSGAWISQVYSPPNLAKLGKKFGKIDAVRVTEGQDLTLEIAEIKSRNTAVQEYGDVSGGCVLATEQADGYIKALEPLKARMAAISQGLAKGGGLKIADCREPNKAASKKLADAGVNIADETDMWAWCVLNAVQNQLGRTFTKGFASVVVKAFDGGKKDADYYAFQIPVSCPDKKPGVQLQIYQVNNAGGISYRCERACTGKKREEFKELEKRLAKELDIQTEAGKETFKIKEVRGDEDIGEDERIEVGPSGIDVIDVTLISAAAVTAMGAYHIAYSKTKSKAEKELIKRAADRLTKEVERRGATDIARVLDGHNLEKLGTKAYKGLDEAERLVKRRILEAGEEKLEKKLIQKGFKKGAKKLAKGLVKQAAKAAPFVGAFIATVDLLNAADAYAKGAEIEIGLSGGEAELEGDTKVDIKGEDPKEHATIEAKMKDTQIHVEIAKAPETTGTIDVETNKVTMKGKVAPDGTPVTVSLTLKIENTTITYISTGRFKKDRKVELTGALDIKDSVMEIDLPPGAEVDPTMGKTRELKGVKIKVNKVATAPGQEKVEGPAKVAEAGDPTTSSKGEKLGAEEAKLVEQIVQDEKLAKLYDVLFKAKGLKPDKAMLERLLALKAKLNAHPEYVDLIIKNQVKEKITDPIKQVIEPIEQLIREAEQKKAEPTAELKPPPGTKPGAEATKKTEEQKTQARPQPGPIDAEKAKATPLEYWKFNGTQAVRTSRSRVEDESAPSQTVTVTATLTYKDREYKFPLSGTFSSKIDPPGPGLIWEAWYMFKPPSSIIKSTAGDNPIYFTDAGTEKKIRYGADKPKPKPAKRKRK